VVAGLFQCACRHPVFANSAGVGNAADIPTALVLLAIPATLILANLIAAGPGWTAARVPAGQSAAH
jgi:hypothetical protein